VPLFSLGFLNPHSPIFSPPGLPDQG